MVRRGLMLSLVAVLGIVVFLDFPAAFPLASDAYGDDLIYNTSTLFTLQDLHPSASESATEHKANVLSAVIDFEGLDEGAIVDQVSSGNGISGDAITGLVGIYGASADPEITTNAAIIFDAACDGGCSGEDDDLHRPELGNVVIIAENLTDADGDGLVDDPDDATLDGASIDLDFSGFGSGRVTVVSIDMVDIEAGDEGVVQLFSEGADGDLLAEVQTFEVGDNEVVSLPIGVSGVGFMRIWINDSGAIDNIVVSSEEDVAFARFDCNGDGIVSSADTTAGVLEISDGDGADPQDVSEGTFKGTAECDANRDGAITASDVDCIALNLFNDPREC